MPTVTYAGGQQTIQFETSDELVAVRTRGTQMMSERSLSPPQMEVMDGMDLEMSFPEANVEIYRRTKGKSKTALQNVRRELRQFPDTRFAGRVLVQKGSGEPVLYTENLFVKFEDSCGEGHCEEMLNEFGVTVKRQLTYARNAYFVEAPEGTGQHVFDMAQTLLQREDVELAHPEIVRRREFRSIAPQQWHLMPATINNQTVNAHVNAEAAHVMTRGAGTTIAVIDDGCDVDHEEFNTSGKIVAPRDATRPTSHPQHDDPRPGPFDRHGTPCCGVACGNGRFESSGVAPDARLMPIRLVAGLGSQAEADAFRWAADHGADVISCSWGPRDGKWFDPNDPLHDTFAPLPDSTRLAIEYAINNGRNGKGCVICWAAGNGNESVDNDGYASFDKVLAIAACNDRGTRSVYSDMGDAIFCAFPSNDFGWPAQGHPDPLTPGIWTTDNSGRAGYNQGSIQQGDAEGDYTNSFGGSSSSCPGAAGVAALVIARNPNLRWDEVRTIMQHSCDQIDAGNGDYDSDGHSKLYGFGRINAERAVRNATASEPLESVIVSGRFNAAVTDFRRTTVSLQVAETRSLEALKVELEIQHTYIGDLIVKLVPPAGSGASSVVLHDRTGRSANSIRRTYDSSSVPKLASMSGVTPTGEWKLVVEDHARRDRGHIRFFALEMQPSATVEDRSAPIGESKSRRKASKSRRKTVKS